MGFKAPSTATIIKSTYYAETRTFDANTVRSMPKKYAFSDKLYTMKRHRCRQWYGSRANCRTRAVSLSSLRARRRRDCQSLLCVRCLVRARVRQTHNHTRTPTYTHTHTQSRTPNPRFACVHHCSRLHRSSQSTQSSVILACSTRHTRWSVCCVVVWRHLGGPSR